MLQPSENSKQSHVPINPNSYTPMKTVSAPTEQATIGRSLVIKGEISGSESLYIDGRIEGSVHLAEHRVTIGRNGVVTANIAAREVVIMGKVRGNIQCSDRLDIRSEGSLTGDVVTPRISVEDGAMIKGSVQVKAGDARNEKQQNYAQSQMKPAMPTEAPKPATGEQPRAIAATANA